MTGSVCDCDIQRRKLCGADGVAVALAYRLTSNNIGSGGAVALGEALHVNSSLHNL